MKVHLILAALSVLTALLSAQNPPPTLEILEMPGNGLILQHYAEAEASGFPKLPSTINVSQLEPFSMILTNNSGKSIVGLTVRWTTTDASGKTSVSNDRSDSFFLVQRPVLPTNGRLLIAPGTFLPESQSGRFMGMMGAGPGLLSQFQGSTKVGVYLDTVIFEGGHVIGPDRSETVADIKARKIAANLVAKAALDAIKNGADPTAVLKQLAEGTRPLSRADHVAVWKIRIARMLLGAPNLNATITALQNLPVPELSR